MGTTLQSSVTEYETKDGDERESEKFTAVIPGRLVEAMGWEAGDELEWSVESANKLGVSQADE